MILNLPIFLISVVLHEYAHGRVANRLGDPTAELAGRLTLNPIPHLDPYGSIVFPLILILLRSPVLIGWAKPVPIDSFNLRHPRRDSAMIAVAGPATNLVIALAASAILYLLAYTQTQPPGLIQSIMVRILQINCLLAVFNLIPVAPLDGFKIVAGVLPRRQAEKWQRLERYGLLFMILLLVPLGSYSLFDILIGPVMKFLSALLIP